MPKPANHRPWRLWWPLGEGTSASILVRRQDGRSRLSRQTAVWGLLQLVVLLLFDLDLEASL